MNSPPKAPEGSRRIAIVEEALHSLNGHWFEYVKTISNACRDTGDDVTVVAHKNADHRIVSELGALPVLPYSAWDKIYDHPNSFRRYAGVFLHNWRLYRAVDRFLQTEKKFDCVLAPTILIHHLIAWTFLAYKHRGKKFGRLVLIFLNGQAIYQGPDRPTHFPRHPKTLLFRFLLRRLKPLVKSGEVVLAAETECMAREYNDFCGVPFQRFAHPVQFESPTRESRGEDPAPLTFSCLGFARHEKGSDLLQEAILQIRKRRENTRIRFIIQWLEDFHLPDGSRVSRHPDLLNDPDVTFITHALDAATYLEILNETDAMILPYRAHSYYARVSRVAIEAAVAGIPLVYTRDTWLEELVNRGGAGQGFRNENLEDLINSTLLVADQMASFKERAEARAHLAKDLHAPENYRASLLGDAPKKQIYPLRASINSVPH